MNIELRINGKVLKDYKAFWNPATDRLVVDIDSKAMSQPESKKVTAAQITLTDLISWDYKRFLPKAFINDLRGMVDKIIESKTIPSSGKYAGFMESKKFDDLLVTFEDNKDMLSSIITRELLNFIFFKSSDALSLREKYFIHLIDSINFKKVQEDSDIDELLNSEKVKSISRLMLNEMKDARNTPGCTTCKLNSIRNKYNQILSTTNFSER